MPKPQDSREAAPRSKVRATARTLFVAPKTVANHVSNIMNGLHFADRAEAIVTAPRARLTLDRPASR